MADTEFEGIPAYKIDTQDYETARRAVKACYRKGLRYVVVDGDDLFIVFEPPMERDGIWVYGFEDNLQAMLNMLQDLRDWGKDDV